MADITKFTTEELEADLKASQEDSWVCAKALALGITEYGGGPPSGGTVFQRLERNRQIVEAITAELMRRDRTDEQELDSQERL